MLSGKMWKTSQRERERERDSNVRIFPQIWKKSCRRTEKKGKNLQQQQQQQLLGSISQIFLSVGWQSSTRVAQVLYKNINRFSSLRFSPFFPKNGFPNKKVSQSLFSDGKLIGSDGSVKAWTCLARLFGLPLTPLFHQSGLCSAIWIMAKG